MAKVKEVMVKAAGAFSHMSYYRPSSELCVYDKKHLLTPFERVGAEKSGSGWYQWVDA